MKYLILNSATNLKLQGSLIRDHVGIRQDPSDVLEEVGQEFGIALNLEEVIKN